MMNIRKILAVLLALVLVVGMLPLGVFATGECSCTPVDGVHAEDCTQYAEPQGEDSNSGDEGNEEMGESVEDEPAQDIAETEAGEEVTEEVIESAETEHVHAYSAWDWSAEEAAYFRTCETCQEREKQEAPAEIGQLMERIGAELMEDLSNLRQLVEIGVPAVLTQTAADYLIQGMTPVTENVTYVARIGNTGYENFAEAVDAAREGDTILVLADSVEFPTITRKNLTFRTEVGTKVTRVAYTEGNFFRVAEGATFDGFEFSVNAPFVAKDLVLRNCRFYGGNGIYYGVASGSWTVENCEFNNSVYGFQLGSDAKGVVNVKNSTFYGGFNTFGTEVNFTGCAFLKGNYNVLQTHAKMTLTNCTIDADWPKGPSGHIGISGKAAEENGAVVALYNCSYAGGNFFDLMEDREIGLFAVDPAMDSSGKYTAGTFNEELSAEMLAEGCDLVKNADGSYTVKKPTPAAPPASSGSDNKEEVKPEPPVLPAAPIVPPTTTVQVPVSKEEGSSVQTTVTITENKATVETLSKETIEKAVDSTGTLTVDMSGLKQDITTAEIPRTTFKDLLETGNAETEPTLKVAMPQGTVALDKTTMEALLEANPGGALQLKLEEVKAVETVELTTVQKQTVESLDVHAVFEASVIRSINNRKVTDLGGGKVTLTVPFTVPEGKNPAGFTVCYVDEDGNKVTLKTTVLEDTIAWEAEAFATFFITYEEPASAASAVPVVSAPVKAAYAAPAGPADVAVVAELPVEQPRSQRVIGRILNWILSWY